MATTLAAVAFFGFIALAMIFSNGAKFRQPLWRSHAVTGCVARPPGSRRVASLHQAGCRYRYAGFWFCFLFILFLLPDCYLTQARAARLELAPSCAHRTPCRPHD